MIVADLRADIQATYLYGLSGWAPNPEKNRISIRDIHYKLFQLKKSQLHDLDRTPPGKSWSGSGRTKRGESGRTISVAKHGETQSLPCIHNIQ